MESSSINLPSDIIFEILSRASLQTLGKCRLLSKEINNLTYESNFTDLHCQRTNAIRGFFIQAYHSTYKSTFVSANNNSNSTCNPSLDFLPAYDRGHVKIAASTKQGILLCTNEKLQIPQYILCKPGTRQPQVIPNPKTSYFTEHIGMAVLRSNPLRLKIVRFTRPRPWLRDSLYSLRCELFDLDAWSWTQLGVVDLPGPMKLSANPAVSACGALHWFTSKNNIFAYNIDKETLKFLELPKLVCDRIDIYQKNIKVVDYEGKLALICMESDQDCMELWILTNYEQQIWNKRYSISINEALRRYNCFPGPNIPAVFCNADVALMQARCGAIFYKFKDGSSRMASLKHHPVEIFPFESDLEPTNLMGRHANRIVERE